MHQVFNEKADLSPKLLVFSGIGCIFIKCICLAENMRMPTWKWNANSIN